MLAVIGRRVGSKPRVIAEELTTRRLERLASTLSLLEGTVHTHRCMTPDTAASACPQRRQAATRPSRKLPRLNDEIHERQFPEPKTIPPRRALGTQFLRCVRDILDQPRAMDRMKKEAWLHHVR